MVLEFLLDPRPWFGLISDTPVSTGGIVSRFTCTLDSVDDRRPDAESAVRS